MPEAVGAKQWAAFKEALEHDLPPGAQHAYVCLTVGFLAAALPVSAAIVAKLAEQAWPDYDWPWIDRKKDAH